MTAPLVNRSIEATNAIGIVGNAIELKPNFPDAYFNRGLSRKNLGENDKAIADYRKAADLYPAYNPWKQKALDRIKELQ